MSPGQQPTSKHPMLWLLVTLPFIMLALSLLYLSWGITGYPRPEEGGRHWADF